MYNRILSAISFAVLLGACGTSSPGGETPHPDSLKKYHVDSEAAAKRDSAATALDTAGEGASGTNDSDMVVSADMSRHLVHLQKGIDLELSLPAGYDISIAYEGLDRLRFLSKSPDGRLFATDMLNVSDNRKGKVYAFDDWDSSAHRFGKLVTYLDGLHNPNQIAFYQDKGKDYIYVSETGTLKRYPYHTGDTIAPAESQTIAEWPDYGLSYKYGGWHLTRSIAFHRDKLYVSVGSSCNACIETEPVRASIQEMNPDGSDKKLFASGLRNSVGIKWVKNKLWVTSMGRDLLGRDRPEDVFQTVEKGGFYGWPFYYQYQGFMLPDTAMARFAKLKGVAVPPPPAPGYSGFRAHSAPLGFDYFSGFADPFLDKSFLVALHGSTTVSRQRGNSVVKIVGPNQYIPVVDGFLMGKTNKDRKGRPCDVLQHDARSFFFTDDYNGVLYYVWKK